MAQISENAEKAIKTLLEDWWTTVNQQLSAATGAVVQIGEAPVDFLFDSEIGQRLARIANAAEGNLEWNPENAWVIFEDCQAIEGWLFQNSITQATPEEFWKTPVGFLVLSARIWAERDELISISEAAKLSGLSLSSLSQRISRGQATGYHDPDIKNPRKSRRIRRSELDKLMRKAKNQEAAAPIYASWTRGTILREASVFEKADLSQQMQENKRS